MYTWSSVPILMAITSGTETLFHVTFSFTLATEPCKEHNNSTSMRLLFLTLLQLLSHSPLYLNINPPPPPLTLHTSHTIALHTYQHTLWTINTPTLYSFICLLAHSPLTLHTSHHSPCTPPTTHPAHFTPLTLHTSHYSPCTLTLLTLHTSHLTHWPQPYCHSTAAQNETCHRWWTLRRWDRSSGRLWSNLEMHNPVSRTGQRESCE